MSACSFYLRIAGFASLLGILLPVAGRADSSPSITNVVVANVTPSSFTVVWATTPGASSTLSVFADPGGATNLAGQVGLEFFPLHTGNPLLTGSYARRLNQAQLRQKTMTQGLAQVRVSGCSPSTTYYFQVQAANSIGQTVWPAAGPLPAVKTAQENAFVIQAQQLIINLPGIDPSGAIVLLSNIHTPSLLAAVAGDGVSSNQVYFNVTDLIAATGDTNYLPLGVQQFTAQRLTGQTNAASQTYSLSFTADFSVGQANQSTLGNYAVVSIGSAVLRAGDIGSLPIGLYASSLTNLTFLLNLPASSFSGLSIQPLSAQLGSATLQTVAANTVRIALAAVSGQTLAGNQQIALLNFTTVSNQSSAFVPFAPQSLAGFNTDGTANAKFAVEPGRLVIVANEPLLETLVEPGGSRTLAVYGKPGASYQIQSSESLAGPSGWSNRMLVRMTNLVTMIPDLDTNQAIVFHRAYEFTPDPPTMEASLAGPNRSLLVYGLPGTNYLLQFATNLSGIVTWYPSLSYTLTNSFQFFTNIGNTSQLIFYRVKKQ
jgi:hypothetical protein